MRQTLKEEVCVEGEKGLWRKKAMANGAAE